MSRCRQVCRVAALSLGVALLVGCHTYRPVESPSPGSTVRVRVPVTSALNNPNRAPDMATVEGLVVSARDTVVLAMETRREFGAYREIVQFDTVRLGPSQVRSIEVREFSTKRSALLGVAIAGTATLAALAAFGFGGGDEGDSPGDDGPVASIIATPSLVSSLLGWIIR
ncbi:MAG: hypothetical protein R3324_10810 [Halobacteriales archaeon]|nr:hypothetical protein [Halobacteriales archaeon]